MAAEKIAYITADEYFGMENLPECCELIDGVIIVMSPSPNQRHQDLQGVIYYQIKKYFLENKGNCRVFQAPSDVKLDDSNVVQPDIYVTCRPEKLDGQKHDGGPDWVVEILSPSTAGRDTDRKYALYKESGVREYWIVNPVSRSVYVHLFDSENDTVKAYRFSDNIPVNIYAERADPLEINIDEYL